ncbi:type II toxin-antitoxin system VapC family toxin [Polyangium fumosum]|uniref:Ribonuclease VapC n=1 Tax=Polyangium fumosum TaxID=889272 RepID=A0A4U1IQH0_9BACT|nr:type II toxin-antitoxin system VapC family toxin [Polyangium fumosum]TKC96461.1 type II toxin-antitoxin system VapC family toxin [Polyangium fumosum]
MKYLLDTCVLSEFAKPRPNPNVLAWLEERDEAALFLSVLTLGELQKGIEKLPNSRRKTALQEWLDHDMRERFAGRLLDVTEEIALTWGRLQGEVERRGQTLPVIDALVGATALAHGLVVVTRNETDIGRTGVRIIDPWADE